MTGATIITARRSPSATQQECACGDHFAHGQGGRDNRIGAAVGDHSAYGLLRAMAEMLWDLQKARIAIQNRALRAAVDPALYEATLAAAERAEHEAALGLTRQYRVTVDLGIRDWQKATRGVGEPLLARLLGVIGHPVWTEKHAWEGEGQERYLVTLGVYRRRVSDLWSYCGHGDPTRRPARGMSAGDAAALGSPQAKTLVWLLACAQLKSTGPYRAVYDDARIRYADRDWTPGHQHNAALRLVGKHLLRDLWRAAGGAA